MSCLKLIQLSIRYSFIFLLWTHLSFAHTKTEEYFTEYCIPDSNEQLTCQFGVSTFQKRSKHSHQLTITDAHDRIVGRFSIETPTRKTVHFDAVWTSREFDLLRELSEPYELLTVDKKARSYTFKSKNFRLRLSRKKIDKSFGLAVSDDHGKLLFRMTASPKTAPRFYQEAGLSEFPTLPEFTLDDALDMAMKQSFRKRIEVQRLKQARENIHESFNNLLPQVGISALIQIGSGAAPQLVFMITDTFGFAFPMKWFQIFETRSLAQAQAYESETVMANLLFEIETQFYSYYLNQKVLEAIRDLNGRIQDLSLHLAKGASPTDHEFIGRKSTLLQLKASSLEALMFQQRMAIGKFIGLAQPEQVGALVLDETRIPNVLKGDHSRDFERLLEIALGRSFELRRFDKILNSLENQKRWRLMSLFDPSPQTGSLFSLKGWLGYRKAKFRTEEAKVEVEKLISEMRGNLFSTLKENQFKAARIEPITEKFREVDLKLDYAFELAAKGEFESLEMTSDYWLELFTQLHADISRLLITEATLDRFTLGGAYHRFFGI